ncbi:hypothetical protein OAA59_01510 [bacterium]|nr:hypothetical protein [bacterium]
MNKFYCYALISALTGCTTYNDKSNAFVNKWRSGDIEASYNGYSKLAKKANNKDKVIFNLEAGTTARAMGNYQVSNENYTIAQDVADDYESKARIKVGSETAAMFSNLATLPYRGSIMDKIMLDTYQGMNYWEIGDLEKARVEFNSLMQKQNEAQVQLEKISRDEYTYNNRDQIEKAKEDYKLKNQINETQSLISELVGYDDFMNPYSEFIYGLFFMYNPQDNSDYDRGLKAMQRVNSLIGGNKLIAANVAEINDILSGNGEVLNSTHIVFETGTAPKRTQTRIDVPLFAVSKKVPYVGAAFPKLEPNDNYEDSLTCVSNDNSYDALEIASFDRMISAEFKKQLPTVITKTILATVVKGVAAYVAQEAARRQAQESGNNMIYLFTVIGTTVWQVAVNNADLRTWNTLPKKVMYTKFETPSNKMIEIKLGEENYPVSLEGKSNLVLIKSNNKGLIPTIRTLVLK